MPYGLEISDAGGAVVFGTDTTMLRYIGEQIIAPDWSGTFPFSGFESADGFFVPAIRCNKADLSPKTVRPDGAAWEEFNFGSTAMPFELPDLVWNDATDIMTVTDNVVPGLFGAFPWSTEIALRFYYFKGGKIDISANYGAEFLNDNGDVQISFEKTLYVRQSGTTKNFFANGYRQVVNYEGGNFAKPHYQSGDDDAQQCATTGFGVYAAPGWDVRYPDFYDRSDLVFFRLTSPITQSCSVYHGYPEIPQGMSTLVAVSGGASIDYKIASLDVPGFVPPESYGLQLIDAAGDVTFDSRYPLIEIVHTEIISEAQMSDIILNGAIVDITLPFAVSDPWICCPYLVAFRVHQDGRVVRPMISKLNSTTLRVQRNKGFGNLLFKQAFQAAWIMVAR